MKVTEILKTKGSMVLTIWPGASLRSAVERMATSGVGALVVVDTGEALIGMLSERDVVKSLARCGGAALTQPISEVMSHPVITCGLDDRLSDLLAVMTHRRVRHLPVVEHGHVVGLVSIGDLVKARLQELELESSVMKDAYLRVR